MKVAVLNAQAPFIWGGAEEMAFHLTRHLRMSGVDAHLVRLPMRWEPAERLLDEMLLARMLKLDDFDVVIGGKFPSYGIPHRDMRIWLVHQYRQAYDMWDSGQSNIPDSPRGRQIREAIYTYDADAFRRSTRLACVAPPSRDRLKKYMGIDAPIVPVPVNDPEIFADLARDNYVFVGGRVNAAKRQHLLIEALAHTKSAIKLVIAGPPEGAEDAALLTNLVRRLGLEDRVVLDLRFVERSKIAEYVNNALAVAYLPVDEDSVGYVTAEAFLAHKPVLTATDSGGVLDIVMDEQTGYVRVPTPAELADGLDRFAAGKTNCVRMGQNGYALWQARRISWKASVAMLLD